MFSTSAVSSAMPTIATIWKAVNFSGIGDAAPEVVLAAGVWDRGTSRNREERAIVSARRRTGAPRGTSCVPPVTENHRLIPMGRKTNSAEERDVRREEDIGHPVARRAGAGSRPSAGPAARRQGRHPRSERLRARACARGERAGKVRRSAMDAIRCACKAVESTRSVRAARVSPTYFLLRSAICCATSASMRL